MSRLVHRRAFVVCGVMALIFTGFSARLIHLQVTMHDEYSALAAAKHSIRLEVSARRGMILDRNGEILATSVPVRKVVIDGSHVNDPAALAALASPYVGIPVDTLQKELTTTSKYKVLVSELAEEKALELGKAMQEHSLRGLYFYANSVRTYPNGRMLSHVLGYLSRKDPNDEHLVGVEGIERRFETALRGVDGFRHIEHDRTGREIVIYRGQEQPARDGQTIRLTIDMGLQAILETELDNTFRDNQPASVVGVIVDPKNGEILAMANRPNFDLNDLNSAEPAGMKNRAIMDMLEPGSIFKIVVASAALHEKVVDQKTLIYCENGRFSYGGRILHDHHGYGNLNLHDILMKSSNIGSAKLALRLGEERFYEYVRRFGFGERTGVDLPGEIRGLVLPPARWDKLTITRMPMGHAVAVTPLQATMAMAVIANGGKLMRPKILRSVSDPEGNVIKVAKSEVIRQVVPKADADFVSNALASVVSNRGTAILASVNGYSVAGKTGTANKLNPEGGYFKNRYVASFVGYMPVEDPRFVCLIMVDDAKLAPNLNYGGLVAAPVFSRIAEKAARYLDLVPAPRAEAILPVALGSRSSGGQSR